jgi:phosphomannomutase
MNERMECLTCFKAYDIRGELGKELNENIARKIGRAYASFIKPKKVILGCDNRLSSNKLKLALSRGLLESGVDVFDIGMCGTEEVYFATSYLGFDGGIQITASHNPINYNGMKFVKRGAQPISGDSGLSEIKALAEVNFFPELTCAREGEYTKIDNREQYLEHILSYIDIKKIKPLKLVINSGNGAAGPVIDAIEARMNALGAPVEFIKINNKPDGNFPNGIPNPLLPERRKDTQDAVVTNNADLGIAFDGDFDRCFFFDHLGRFVEGYYIVGLLAEAFLKKQPGAKIIHDPRLTWNTIEIVKKTNGVAVQSKTGHAFIKEKMREEDALYGGEMSAHHYFKDFSYCDSGMIPWLLIIELLSIHGQSLKNLIDERVSLYPTSGELNCNVSEPERKINEVFNKYRKDSIRVDYTDGLSMEFSEWRFNLRCSNTEPLVRLNVEAKNNEVLMKVKTNEIMSILSET